MDRENVLLNVRQRMSYGKRLCVCFMLCVCVCVLISSLLSYTSVAEELAFAQGTYM